MTAQSAGFRKLNRADAWMGRGLSMKMTPHVKSSKLCALRSRKFNRWLNIYVAAAAVGAGVRDGVWRGRGCAVGAAVAAADVGAAVHLRVSASALLRQ